MKKNILLGVLLASTVLLGGCAHKISSYSPSFSNMTALHGMSGNAKKINLGEFTDPKNTQS
ncbi:MAG: hypothetical protein NTZ67_04205 [Gammaproteobacteria bacterium]|nr:hypothetical protein [Gammaproteobacteria bacterium]